MRTYTRTFLLLPILAVLALAAQANDAPATGDTATTPTRAANWARPIEGAGLSNAYRVSPTLYRSAQPTADGFRSLEQMGIKSIMSLRSFNSDRDEIKGTDLKYQRLTMKAWHPEDKEVVAECNQLLFRASPRQSRPPPPEVPASPGSVSPADR